MPLFEYLTGKRDRLERHDSQREAPAWRDGSPSRTTLADFVNIRVTQIPGKRRETTRNERKGRGTLERVNVHCAVNLRDQYELNEKKGIHLFSTKKGAKNKNVNERNELLRRHPTVQITAGSITKRVRSA